MLHEQADKVIDTLDKMRSIADVVANIPVPRGLKKRHKQFWIDFYQNELHLRFDNLLEEIGNWELDEIGLPFSEKEFEILWLKYKRHFHHQEGKSLSAEREEIQLDTLQEHYNNAHEAIKALKYIINKGHTFIYKVNFDSKNKQKNKKNDSESDNIDYDEFD